MIITLGETEGDNDFAVFSTQAIAHIEGKKGDKNATILFHNGDHRHIERFKAVEIVKNWVAEEKESA